MKSSYLKLKRTILSLVPNKQSLAVAKGASWKKVIARIFVIHEQVFDPSITSCDNMRLQINMKIIFVHADFATFFRLL